MGQTNAVDELIRRAADPAVAPEALQEIIGRVFRTFSPHDRAGAEAVVQRLADEIIDAPTRPDVAGTIALFCGALVESGLSPCIALDAILNRLEQQIAPEAIAFVSACRDAATPDKKTPPSPTAGAGLGDDGAEEGDDPVEPHGERIAALLPGESRSFHALEPFSLAAVAMLARSVEARKASWSRAALRGALDSLGGQYGPAGFLWTMLQVLDDEPIVVLHPEQCKGYRVRISGLGDNFQLHTLLADALIGTFSGRWLKGRRPRKVEVSAARDGSVSENAPPAVGSFNLWTWRGLTSKCTLRDAKSGSDSWVWNEGVPADIPKFEGTRVELLGPPPYERSWDVGRKFPAMAGSLHVESILEPAETRDLLHRMAAAAPE